MENKDKNENYEAEVIREMEPFVRDKLKYLIGDRRKWWASDFFNFMEKDDEECFDKLKELREEARELRDEELVVLVGNEVTEEALPNYSRRLANLFPDDSGTSQNAWNIWERGWAAEEKMHGRVLDGYLLLGGRVNKKAVDISTDSLIEKGMEDQPGIFRGLVYPAFQEPATATSHINMMRVAGKRGVQTLYDICGKIAQDENRHAKFYSEIVTELMRREPEIMMIAYSELMKDNVVMPAKNMIDETYTEPPTLFEHFAGVANKIGVYTANDYANIVKKLNRNFKVAEASVTGMAAKSQEHLCNLPERLERFAERTKYRMTKPVGFDWIYGRTA